MKERLLDNVRKRRTSAQVRAAKEREEMVNGFIEIMDDALFIDGNGQGREGYVGGMRECAERITDAVLGGIKAAGEPTEKQQEALKELVAHAWDAEPKQR